MQIFHRSTNTIAKVSIFGAVFFIAFFAWIFLTLLRSSYATGQGIVLKQPVPFSHAPSRRRPGDRLPVLPHVRRDLRLRRACRPPRPA